MKRRSLLAGVGSMGLASMAGCLGLVGMDTHEATPAGVEPDVRSETEYAQTGVSDLVVEKSVDLAVHSETITVTNYLTKHEKTIDMGPLGEKRGAIFHVLSSPKIEILGDNHNPVEDMTSRELVDLIENNYDMIENISEEESLEITILDQNTNVTKFTADAQFNGYDVEVNLHISEAVETDEDLIVTIGVYPTRLEFREQDNIYRLMESVLETAETNGDSAPDEDGGNETDGSNGSSGSDGDSGDGTGGNDGGENSSEDDGDGLL